MSGTNKSSSVFGEDIVISGLSGRYPDSYNVHHFKNNLFNKVDMVSKDSRRWEPNHPEIPQRTGMVYNLEKFDSAFFGISHAQGHSMDPMVRLFLEVAVEAVFDAGIHPDELVGTRTGVFVGVCFSESEKTWFTEKVGENSNAFTGVARSMIANRVSYFLKLDGPSYVTDTACSSSLYALENAVSAIRLGKCDKAIIGGANICLHPFVSLQFARLGVLSNDGACKCFDAAGNGYARSEAICAIILEKAKDARRIYSTLVHAKTNCDGYKEQGITYPSGKAQMALFQEFYDECKIDPARLSYVEAHGTGTKVGDPEEVYAIDEILTKNRQTPLWIGSVKSNIGHSEPSSGLCSITKCIIGMEAGFMPPNLHFKTPRQGIKALEEGRLKVVVDKTPIDEEGLLGVNSFGFGGGNAHILLKRNEKEKINGRQPKDDYPRLVLLSGRTEKAMKTFIEDVRTNNCDTEYIRLLHQLFSKNISCHLYRGYSILYKNGKSEENFDRYLGQAPNLNLCFGTFFTTWKIVADALVGYPPFESSLQRVQNILTSFNVNIMDIITEAKSSPQDKILGSICVGIAIIDILKSVDVKSSNCMAISYGHLLVAYYSNILTLEETVLCGYVIGKNGASKEKMAYYMINLPIKQLPEGVYIIAHTSNNSVIIGGRENQLNNFINTLRTSQASYKCIEFEILAVNRALFLKNKANLLKELNNIIKPKGKPKNFANNLYENILSPLVLDKVDKQDVLLDLEAGLDLKGVSVSLLQGQTFTFTTLLHALGQLYILGCNLTIHNLYPEVKYPVSRGTPMISPSIKWDWRRDWFVSKYTSEVGLKNGEKNVKISYKDDGWSFIRGHVIDGRNLFPAAGYLQLVWETLSYVNGVIISDTKVTFDNCKFLRATALSKEQSTELTVMIQRVSGNFEVIEGDQSVVKGRVTISINEFEDLDLPLPVGVTNENNLPMSKKDVYKELRLRGYNYKGQFRSIEWCNAQATRGLIKWTGNWITFMDNMLQMHILQTDTRLLYVPTGIKQLRIDARKHIDVCKTLGEAPDVPVYVYKDMNIVRAGAVEIKGLLASSIALRKPLGEPVLEKYVFVPNVAELKTEDSIRINMQVVLENFWTIKVKVVELVDDTNIGKTNLLSPYILKALGDQPLIQPNVTVLSTRNDFELENIQVEDRNLSSESDCHLIVGSNILKRSHIHHQILLALKENGFILTRELPDVDTSAADPTFTIFTVHKTETETLLLLRKKCLVKEHLLVDVSDERFQFSWLESMKRAINNDEHVIAYTQGHPLSGILGLVNCLRREPGGLNVKTFFLIDQDLPQFNVKHPLYLQQLEKNMAVNVYKNGKWGTYRHLLLDSASEVEAEHCYVNVTTRGDLSSLRWIEGPLQATTTMKPENLLLHVYYVALNFRDIMTASGRINVDVITQNRTEQECVQGFEFSGRDNWGNRKMGMVVHGALATLISADKHLLWDVPDHWTLEDAATIPVVYGTVIYGLVTRAHMKKGDVILIHSGSGGIGQAAIQYALHFGCQVYTTVGTVEKRQFLKKRFPQLKDHHIGNSRDVSFEQLIMNETKGRGVDIILNSLAEEKLQASVRCLAKGGRFLEIGKYDLANDSLLKLQLFQKEASFHGVMLDQLFAESPIIKINITRYIEEGIKMGAVVPLTRTVFRQDEVEKAFRFMATGKHIGKVLIKVRNEEKDKCSLPGIVKFKGLPRYTCDQDKSYIILGGLGGFGLELADWLVLRGARKLILTSRTGIKTGYQSSRIRIWKSYGALIHVSTADVTKREGCLQLLKEAAALGTVEGIFNLAVVLKDALLENQNQDMFRESFAPKALATIHLDEVSRELCRGLKDFVVFSSVSCGRGNSGQTNYGMANSVMERICEKRHSEGYPALAIQWGAIGEVGLVAELQEEQFEMEIGGTLQQKISSCLKVLDLFLRQNSPVVGSMVVAEKRSGAGFANNAVDAVANILGFRDLKSVSLHSSLAEMGMDSMTAVEIKQTLEREFDIFLTAQDIRGMTFAKLQEMQSEREEQEETFLKKDKAIIGMDMFIRCISEEKQSHLRFVKLKSKLENTDGAKKVILFPGIDGLPSILKSLSQNLEAEVVALQYCNADQEDSLELMAGNLLRVVKEQLDKNEPFFFIGHSFGTVMALEVVSSLEREGYGGRLISIDGSPAQQMEVSTMLNVSSSELFETSYVLHLMSSYVPFEVIAKNKEAIFRCTSFEDKIKKGQEIVGSKPDIADHQRAVAVGTYKRIKGLLTYKPTYNSIKTPTTLFKPKLNSMHVIRDDYKLNETLGQVVEVKVFDGNHVTILENKEMAEEINRLIHGREVEVNEEQDFNKPAIIEPSALKVQIQDRRI